MFVVVVVHFHLIFFHCCALTRLQIVLFTATDGVEGNATFIVDDSAVAPLLGDCETVRCESACVRFCRFAVDYVFLFNSTTQLALHERRTPTRLSVLVTVVRDTGASSCGGGGSDGVQW